MGVVVLERPIAGGGDGGEGELVVEEEAGNGTPLLPSRRRPPEDAFHLAYAIYFTLGAGFLIPWNAFITAVDYFSYLYPAAPVDRVFAVTYMLCALAFLLLIVGWWAHRSGASARINSGLLLFVLTLLLVPVLDAAYVKGRRGLYGAYAVTVAAVAVSGIADAFVQGGVVGAAGELPERYMQAVVAGTAASGVLVSVLRILTKAMFSQDASGLRSSANLYFSVSIVFMAICLVSHNVADRLPVVRYYKDLKLQAMVADEKAAAHLTGAAWRSTLWEIVGRIKWFGFGILLIYVVTLSIFPGYITQDVQPSAFLGDWYPILLIAAYNVFDLLGKCLPAVRMLHDENVAVAGCVARLLFFPLFLVCLHGPGFFRTEMPVTVLTCLLGLSNGYLTGVLMILAPKAVPIQHAETAGIAIVLFLIVGLAIGSVVSWFWII